MRPLPIIKRLLRVVPGLGTMASGRRTRFITSVPSPQTAVDLFPSGWASKFPAPYLDVRAGQADLFADTKLRWGINTLGGVAGQRVLELGPLEGAHSYALQTSGAEQVVAVEANSDAFLKCLVVKELYSLDRCRFLCGDAVEYLRSGRERFDLCVAAGILYHMSNPVELIDLIGRRADRIYIWTHFYDESLIASNRRMRAHVDSRASIQIHEGYRHDVHRNSYGLGVYLPGHWGGTQKFSNWLTRQGLLDALAHYGWTDVQINSEDDTPNGPAISLVAERR